MNKICPYMADEITKVNCAVAGPGLRFTYKYTIISDLTQEQ